MVGSKHGGEEQRQQQQHDESLATLLASQGHEELFIGTIQNIASSMREDIDALFSVPTAADPEEIDEIEVRLDDAAVSESADASHEPMMSDTWDSEPGMSSKEAQKITKQRQKAEKQQDKAQKQIVKRKEKKQASDAKQREKNQAAMKKQLDSEEFSDLREKSLRHFDAWSTQALGRITDELRLEMDEQQASENGPGNVDSLQDLPELHRMLILHSCLLLLLGLEHYWPESRVFLKQLLAHLGLAKDVLVKEESKVAQGLAHAADSGMDADEETKKRIRDKKVARRWMIGAGAAVGATLIGVTGGLAAPLLAAGVGSAMAGIGLGSTAVTAYLGAMAGSAPLIGVLFGAYGGKMAGELVGNYAKEVSDFAFIPVRKSTFTKDAASRRLRVAIGVSGWVTEGPDVVKPWQFIGKEGFESYALRWELDTLLEMGHAMGTYSQSAAWGFAKSQAVAQTTFATLSAALWPLGVARAARLVDNPFTLALQKSVKAGRVLADALCNKVQGERPVTLLGYSIGARVIVSCLEELAKRRAFGIVENVVLAGAANSRDTKVWRRIRAVVSGRVINAYSTNDHLLAFLFRTHNMTAGVAGLGPIEHVHGVENVDVSSIVSSHFQYRYLTGQIMSACGFEDIDHHAVEREIERMQKETAQVEKKRAEKERIAREEGLTSESEAKKMEEQVEQKRKPKKEKMDDAMNGFKQKFSKMSMNRRGKGESGTDGSEVEQSDSASEYNMDISTKANGGKTKQVGTKGAKSTGKAIGGFVPGPV
ncbi:hypothetical protein WHR41_05323 [Cladosporium halotolerans]|uniref:DUF726-domain-containing protein n=1 Tax=Cladosporium halotolerans TaxID=1052096 RepID=A0AB34KP54_9PEZI